MASLAYAVRSALAQAGTGGDEHDPATHVWVLTSDSAAAPMTLARLLDAVRRSPSVGAAGPKLLDWTRAGALRSVGLQLTRSGRVIPSPAPGEPDQGQYDRRSDVLAIPATGMLVERGLLDELGGPERAFGDFGADVDFSWRAQQSGRRVVVVPRATLRTGAGPAPDDVGPGRLAHPHAAPGPPGGPGALRVVVAAAARRLDRALEHGGRPRPPARQAATGRVGGALRHRCRPHARARAGCAVALARHPPGAPA